MATINEFLVTFEDIQGYLPDIANNYDRSEIEPYILDVQRMDLAMVLGASLYRDCYINKLQTAPTNYVELIQGAVYQCNEQDVDYYGLVPFISYLVYYRLLVSSSVKITRSGPMQKANPYSSKVQGGELKTMIDMAAQKAAFYKDNLINFLCNANYPLATCCSDKSRLPKSQAFVVQGGYYKYPDQGSSLRYY